MKTELRSNTYGGNIHEFASHAARNLEKQSLQRRARERIAEARDETLVQYHTIFIRAYLLISRNSQKNVDGHDSERSKKRSRFNF